MAKSSTQPGVPSLLRVLNDRATLELLLTDGSITRAELGRRTGLSRVTASQSLSRLQARGLVEVVGSRSGGRGPNAEVYAVRDHLWRAIGLDLRASGVGVTVSSVTGDQLERTWEPVDGSTVVDLAARVVSDMLERSGVRHEQVLSAVAGVPGLVDPGGGDIAFAYDLPEAGAGLRTALEARLEMPVTLENDVNLAAVAESRLGAAAGEPDFVLVWVGAGVGLAVTVDGRLHRGATGAAGEIGYLPVPGVPLPERVDHVSQGSFQRLVGTPALAVLADQHGLNLPSPRNAAAVAAAVSHAANGGHEAFLNEVARRIALGVAAVCTVLDPGLVVLSGETGLAGGQALAERVGEQVERVAPVHPHVVVSGVGDGAVLDGASLRAVRASRQTLLAGLDDLADAADG
jgi:predicted NBD/HSP70 family sugar kinase